MQTSFFSEGWSRLPDDRHGILGLLGRWTVLGAALFILVFVDPPAMIYDIFRGPVYSEIILVIYSLLRVLILGVAAVLLLVSRHTFLEDIQVVTKSPQDNDEQGRSFLPFGYRLALFFSIALVTAFLIHKLNKPISGSNTFRQAHIAANVEFMVANGIFTWPEVYNVDVPRHFFDFPIYQGLATIIIKISGASILPAIRLMNLVIFDLGLFFFSGLLFRLGVSANVRLFALMSVLASPLLLFYLGAPLPDLLAIVLGLAALYGFVRSEEGGIGWYLLFFVSSFLATLIKNPVFLPMAIAVFAFTIKTKGFRGLLHFKPAVYFGMLLLTVIGFKLITSFLEPGTAGQQEWDWYFGTMSQRLDPSFYSRIGEVLLWDVMPWLLMVFAILGGILLFRSASTPWKIFLIGWLGGCFLTSLIFFRMHQHNYYQLIYVFPFAYFVGVGFSRFHDLPVILKDGSRFSQIIFFTLLSFAAVIALHETKTAYDRLDRDRTSNLRVSGQWLFDNTSKEEFVFYCVEKAGWNPAHLYFAKRFGYNLQEGEDPDLLVAQFKDQFDRMYLYCPNDIPFCPCKEREPELSGPMGRLFLLNP